MRAVTWLVLVALAAVGLTTQHPSLALAVAGAKALAVGLEFMELKHAARAHLGLFLSFVVGLVVVLELILR